MDKRAHLTISGNVQGVAFRNFIKTEATRLSLTGHAKNLKDYIDVIVEGEEERIKELVEKCKKGPTGALVKNVDIKWEEFKKEFSSFQVAKG